MKDCPPIECQQQQAKPSAVMDRWSNAIKRIIFGTVMIFSFVGVIFVGGPVALILLVLGIQVACFRELIGIGHDYNQVPDNLVPRFRLLSWYFLMAANYFLFGETVSPHFQFFGTSRLAPYHRFLSFCLYFVGIVVFVLSLVRKHDLKQFRIFAWTHLIFWLIVLQSYMVIENIFHGLIWFILPVSLVILNDIFAYAFGKSLGRTPLIKVSPNKTWEGFLGGIVGTVIVGYVLSNAMCKYQYFTCPNEIYQRETGFSTDCTPSYLFQPAEYQLNSYISFTYYPAFFKHFLAMALFASVVAPFGGFCASGFKRALKIKDFSDTIPGHGGIMDRADCQFLMSFFVNVYIFTFARGPSLDLLFQKILYLKEEDQLEFFHMLGDVLEQNKHNLDEIPMQL